MVLMVSLVMAEMVIGLVYCALWTGGYTCLVVSRVASIFLFKILL
jgi:hypothetical protein